MKAIRYFNLKNIRNAEHFQFHWMVVAYLSAVINQIIALIQLWLIYYTGFGSEDTLYKQSRKSSETLKLRKANTMRGKLFKLIKFAIETALLDPDTGRQEAAQNLKDLFNVYKNASQKTYLETTALITNLMQDLEKPENDAYVTLLGLSESINALAAQNQAFDLLYKKRSESNYVKKAQGSMNKARTKTDKSFYDLVSGINALYQTNEITDKDPQLRHLLGEAIDAINSYIDQIELVYARRNAKYKVKKSNGSEEEPVPDMEIPVLSMKNQMILSGSQTTSGSTTQMSMEAMDREAFAVALYPAASGGVVRLRTNENTWINFPIADFKMDGASPVGLILDPNAPDVVFVEPFQGIYDSSGEVVKDNVLLAILDEVEFPATVING
ncbi:MAG: DUF6261 family protein [Tannerellaceae bacterium]|jgi:hypothetical protein|nr:DUF6261 family protein [Tannerellaceae bacterium]